jgi:uncharacterized protein (UPF0333 family)
MKRKFAVVLLLVVLAAGAAMLYAADVTCPIDHSSAYFTGNTKTDVSGKLLKEYKCNMYGHLFWVVD